MNLFGEPHRCDHAICKEAIALVTKALEAESARVKELHALLVQFHGVGYSRIIAQLTDERDRLVAGAAARAEAQRNGNTAGSDPHAVAERVFGELERGQPGDPEAGFGFGSPQE